MKKLRLGSINALNKQGGADWNAGIDSYSSGPSSSPGTVCLAILRNYAHPQRRPCSACVCVRLTQTLPAPNVAAQETEAESD